LSWLGMVGRGDVKLLHNNPFEPLELYNLGDDPQEEANLSGSQRDIFREMGRLLETEMQKNGRVPW